LKRTILFLLALCSALVACKPGSVDLQVLSLSDWHGQIDPLSAKDADGNTVAVGGASVLSSYFKNDRAANPDTLVFTAGDGIGASPALSSFFDEKPAIAALNALKIDAYTYGNHDFDRGLDALRARMQEAQFAYISTNLTNATAEFGARTNVPYRMYEVGKEKVKVAVLGLTNPDAPLLNFPGRMGTLVVADPAMTANAAAKQARDAGASVVIALAHLGATNKDENGNPVGPAIDLAKALVGVDVLLADHTDIAVNTTINNVLVVENRSKGLTYAKLQIKVVEGKVTAKTAEFISPVGVATAPLPTGQTCPNTACPASFTCSSGACKKTVQAADADVDALIQPYRDQLAPQLDGKLGTIDTTFARDSQAERTNETPLGDLVADALLEKYSGSGAQLAFTNGGGLRASVPSSYTAKATGLVRTGCSTATPCDVLAGDIYTVLPFGNLGVVRKLTGATLWQVLDYSVAKYPAADGRFLQVAGIRFEYSASAAPGVRVTKVTLLNGNKDIPRTDATEYTIVTNDFTNAGGDGYTMLVEPSPSAAREILAATVLDYVKAKGAIHVADYPLNRIIRNP